MKHLILFCAICLLTFISKAQDFLNGDFEINTAVMDQINLNNSSFNNFMPNSTAFGTFENLDIITSNTYCGVALSGDWFIALTGGGTDAITMELSEPLVAGEEYTISFWDRGCDAFSYGPLSVNIGVSSSPIAVGTIVYSSPTPTESVWTQRIATFIAPTSDLYISVRLISSGGESDTGYWTQVDNFSMSTESCPETIDLGPDLVVCAGDTANLAINLPGAMYEWQDGSTNDSFAASAAGKVYISATIGNCVYTDTVNITISDPVLMITENDTICAGDSIELSVSGADAYSWSPQGSLTNIEGEVTVASPQTTTTYAVTGTLGECEAFAEVTITVNVIPLVTVSQDVTICLGDETELLASGATDFVWFPSSSLSNSSGNAVTASPIETTTYTVEGNENGCTQTDDVTVTVALPPFAPEIEVVDGILQSTPAFDYQWFLNGEPISGATDQTYIPNAEGSYMVVITNEPGCTSSSESIFIAEVSEVANPDNVIYIFPIPVVEALSVFSSVQISNAEIRILDIQGRVIAISRTIIPIGNSVLDLPVGLLSDGIYVLEVFDGKSITKIRWMKMG